MSQVRAFLAIDLDDDLKPKIHKVIKQFKQTDANIKYVELNNLHLTLKFFGDIDTEGLSVLEEKIAKLNNREVLLVENTRFEDIDGKKESSCDEALSKYWASLGDIFINDAFGLSHRKHASNYGLE